MLQNAPNQTPLASCSSPPTNATERLRTYLEQSLIELKPLDRAAPHLRIEVQRIGDDFGLSADLVTETLCGLAEALRLEMTVEHTERGSSVTLRPTHEAPLPTDKLTKSEWDKLLKDPEKLRQCIEEFLPMAHAICCKIAKGKGIRDLQQLDQHGRVALLRLLLRYNPERGPLPQFVSTYLPREIASVWREEQTLRRGLRNRSKDLERIRNELLQRGVHSEQEFFEEASRQLGLTMSQIASSLGAIAAARARSFEGPAGINILENRAGRTGDHFGEQQSVDEFLLKLPIVERRMVELRMLGCSLKDIGYIFSLAECTISQRLANVPDLAAKPHPRTLGLGYSVLAREEEVLRQSPRSWPDLLPYIDGLTFFSLLRRFRAKWSEEIIEFVTGGTLRYEFQRLPTDSRIHLRNLIRALNPNINRIRPHILYSEILNLPEGKWWSTNAIATSGIRYKIFDWRAPLYESIGSSTHGGGRSKHFVSSVVGSDQRVAFNRRQFVRYNFHHLDEISQTAPCVQGLAALVGVGGSRTALARKLVELGDLSPQRPPKLSPWRGSSSDLSFYFEPEVVGPTWARRNFNNYFLEVHPHVDAVFISKLFPLFLHGDLSTAEGVARAAVAQVPGFSLQRPRGYSLARNGVERGRVLAFFYHPSIVTPEVARQNLENWALEQRFTTSALSSRLLAKALNLTRREGELTVPEDPVDRGITRQALAQRGWLR